MSIFYPDINLKNVTEITKEMLDSNNIKGLIIDIDNTLAGHNSQEIDDSIKEWFYNIRRDFDCILVSNNFENRVKPFADMLNVDYLHTALKPVPILGIAKAAKKIGKKNKEIALIGDQIFTDIWGGNWFGAMTIKVEPLSIDEDKSISFKRKLEKKLMDKYNKTRG